MKYVLGEITQRYDNEWFNVRRKDEVICCCDCGLTHRLDFRIRGNKIQMKAARDKALTEQRRKSQIKTKGSLWKNLKNIF